MHDIVEDVWVRQPVGDHTRHCWCGQRRAGYIVKDHPIVSREGLSPGDVTRVYGHELAACVEVHVVRRNAINDASDIDYGPRIVVHVAAPLRLTRIHFHLGSTISALARSHHYDGAGVEQGS